MDCAQVSEQLVDFHFASCPQSRREAVRAHLRRARDRRLAERDGQRAGGAPGGGSGGAFWVLWAEVGVRCFSGSLCVKVVEEALQVDESDSALRSFAP